MTTPTLNSAGILEESFPAPLIYRRRPTRVVPVGELGAGGVGIGGGEPIRVQSMLTANTWDVPRVIAEMQGLVAVGCEIIRLTVPTRRDLEALPEIRETMRARGLAVPLVADIHFNPKLALGVVPHVEKVRINPGNYVDQKRFQVREYNDAQYAEELLRVEEALLPLIGALKTHRRALRVGVNHGSLSDRVLNRFGDTPRGMVECAMEYLRILARHGYHENIVSMKSSNPLVVIRAYRLLVLAMNAEGMDYPLHLGVTEAGDGADGRIKSAIGIGALLCDGLGDTVRVSLTEAAANEIPAARELVAAIDGLRSGPAWPEVVFPAPQEIRRRETRQVSLAAAPQPVRIGGDHPVAFLGVDPSGSKTQGFRLEMGPAPTFDGVLSALPVIETGPEMNAVSVMEAEPELALLVLEADQVDSPALERLITAAHSGASPDAPPRLLVLRGEHPLYPLRWLAQRLERAGLRWPLGLLLPENGDGALPLGLAAEAGSLAADGLLDAILCPATGSPNGPARPSVEYARTLLQAARLRTYRTEYISCPSCGRTLFDLEETTARIKARTSHLKGLRIGIMGCIVNGPGEMADADFGYVGGAPDRINLYKGQTCLERGIPAEQAVERLVALIKEHGAWVEPGG